MVLCILSGSLSASNGNLPGSKRPPSVYKPSQIAQFSPEQAVTRDPGAFRPSSGKKDTSRSDSSRQSTRNRRLYFGLQLGANFIDFAQAGLFKNDLNMFINEKYSADSILAANAAAVDSTTFLVAYKPRILQPYDQVIIAFPAGLVLGIPVTSYLDICLSTQSFWQKQQAIIEHRAPDTIVAASLDTARGKTSNISREYAFQANLIGCGIKLYIPFAFLSVEDDKAIYLSYSQLWNLGNSELYSDEGYASSGFPIYGIGFDVALGFQLSTWKNIGMSRLAFPASKEWGEILLQNSAAKMEWRTSALKFNFQFAYQLGGFPSPKKDETKRRKKPVLKVPR
ncbi:hypothetical protein ACFL5V_13765 [Fibrobacterota bacterium]